MSLYSISELEKYSGIKAHTIRIWEQRYGILKPKRTRGNTRFYNDSELKKLLNISNLIKAGKKISEISKMEDIEMINQINNNLNDTVSSDVIADHFTGQMITAGLNYDIIAFEKSFSASFLKLGINDTYTKVIYPLLRKIGLMWREDDLCPAQEHFVSNLVRQKLFSVIDALPVSTDSHEKWILFLPEDEEHEIGLLYTYYFLRSMNLNVIYLGGSVPVDSLKDAVSKTGAKNLFFFYSAANSQEDLKKYINTLSGEFKEQKLYLSGNNDVLEKIKLGANCKHVLSPEGLKELILKK